MGSVLPLLRPLPRRRRAGRRRAQGLCHKCLPGGSTNAFSCPLYPANVRVVTARLPRAPVLSPQLLAPRAGPASPGRRPLRRPGPDAGAPSSPWSPHPCGDRSSFGDRRASPGPLRRPGPDAGPGPDVALVPAPLPLPGFLLPPPPLAPPLRLCRRFVQVYCDDIVMLSCPRRARSFWRTLVWCARRCNTAGCPLGLPSASSAAPQSASTSSPSGASPSTLARSPPSRSGQRRRRERTFPLHWRRKLLAQVRLTLPGPLKPASG